MERKDFFQAIADQSQNYKVAFINSYKRASKYSFYTGRKSFSYNTATYRKNQYDIGKYENEFHNESVFLVDNWKLSPFKIISLPTGEKIPAKVVNKFPVVSRIKATPVYEELIVKKGKTDSLTINFMNPYDYDIYLQKKSMPVKIILLVSKGKKMFFLPVKTSAKKLKAGSSGLLKVPVNADDIPVGNYPYVISLQAGDLYPQTISRKHSIVIEE